MKETIKCAQRKGSAKSNSKSVQLEQEKYDTCA